MQHARVGVIGVMKEKGPKVEYMHRGHPRGRSAGEE